MSETRTNVQNSAKQATAKKTEHVIYIGPTIKGVVQSNTAFTNGYPEKLKKYLEDNPIAKELIVPVKNLADARKQLKDVNSPLAVFFNTLNK